MLTGTYTLHSTQTLFMICQISNQVINGLNSFTKIWDNDKLFVNEYS